MYNIRNFALTGVSLLAMATPAFAQQQVPADEAAQKDEIVVTGTLVRGAEPAGNKVIGINRSAVEATGASTVTQLLATVPQLASFNSLQTPVGGGTTVTTNRPNLRNLAASNTNGAASTLMLIDGHRVVGMGISVTSPDLDTIAPGAIERVEIVPDGGSSIYGADAVGGVINFITRKTFNGVAVDGRIGFADNYQTWDTNATVGKTWDGGGVYVSYNYSQHDPLFGRDLDYVHQFETQLSGVPFPTIGIECTNPNVRIVGNSTAIYGLPFTPNAAAKLNQPNQCDYSDGATIYPKERRHSVFVSLTQDLSDSLTFDLKGFFMDRKQHAVTGYFHTTKTIGTGGGQLDSPFRSQNIISSANEAQTVSFGFGGDEAGYTDVHLRAWGITPELTARFGDNWRLRTMLNYGESDTEVHSRGSSPLLSVADTALTNAIKAGLFNPYNPASSNPAALAAIASVETFGKVRQTQLQARAILDGELFDLPGGRAKLAVGAEYVRETFRTQKGDTVAGYATSGYPGLSINNTTIISSTAVPGLPIFQLSRRIKSVFGELVLPLAADTPMLQELTLSASARYDDYSDFGHTFNPKIGLTWKPFEALRLRGQWSKSFSAPSLANSATADPSRASWSTGFVFSGVFVTPAAVTALQSLGYPAPTAQQNTVLTLTGGSNQLKPQTARSWSVGADLDPFRGARLSMTYWNIRYKNLIASPIGTAASNPPLFFNQFLASYKINPAQADIDALLAQATQVSGAPCSPLPQCLYVLELDATQNLGRFNASGLDFGANYATDTGFGSIDFNLAATYLLERDSSVSATAPLVDQFPFGFSRFSLRTALGAQIHKLRAQVTWNHSAGYDFAPASAALGSFYPAQSHVGAFNTFDLFFKYDFDGKGVMEDLALTLGVSNVFNQGPPVRYVGGGTTAALGYSNGSTIGRLVQVGFSKKF